MADSSDNGGNKIQLGGVGEYHCGAAQYITYSKNENDLIEKDICPRCGGTLGEEKQFSWGAKYKICKGVN